MDYFNFPGSRIPPFVGLSSGQQQTNLKYDDNLTTPRPQHPT